MVRIGLVIPCYNEERRIDLEYWDALANRSDISLVFVNDGSTDRTNKILEELKSRHPKSVECLHFKANRGKAKAVRSGMTHISGLYDWVGFLDADGAFPLKVVEQCLEITHEPPSGEFHSFWFSRVKLAGSNIERNWFRHYLGRIMVTFATFGLINCPYDTQAGFKVFKNHPRLNSIWEEQFTTKWLFDIELFIRISRNGMSNTIKEIPVSAWRDVAGSKINFRSYLFICLEFLKIITLRLKFQGIHT